MAYRPILCLDFDGVLHSYESGWSKRWFAAARIADGPTSGAMQWLHDAYEGGRFRVAVFSSRSKTPWGRWAMRRWLRRHLIAEFGQMAGPNMGPLYLEILDWIEWPWFKPAALITLDDRAITFDGTWPPLDALAGFKPWNKR